MAIPNVMHTGRSAMQAAKAAMSATGHNISNASTEGFSRQKVEVSSQPSPAPPGSKMQIGQGVTISRVGRMNDEYIEKQIINASLDKSSHEEKDLMLRQTEDIFNEMGGEGLNRLMSRFFNEFRKLANEPDNQAVRQSVREATMAMVNDVHRMRASVEDVRVHIDSRINGAVSDINAAATEIRDLNQRVQVMATGGGNPNDLMDQRDRALRKLAQLTDIQMFHDPRSGMTVNLKGIGPLVSGPNAEQLDTFRSPADEYGKVENALDIKSSSSAKGIVTHVIKGGKLGALLDVRDKTLSVVANRLDELAYSITSTVNEVHQQGFTMNGAQGANFFKPINQIQRAAEFLDLSDEVKASVNNIATAAAPDSPGDNRIALAISGIQGMRVMGDGKSTVDEFYNAIVGDVGVVTARNRNALNQQKDIQTQLEKMREQISGVSIDEETTNLLQFQHTFDASAKVIQIADEMMKTVLDLKR